MVKCRANYVPLVVLLTTPVLTFGCTTLLAGKDATIDGSVMATHSNDGEGTTDPRLVRIPARDWPKGSKRPVFPNPESYPRFVGGGSDVGNRGVPSYDAKPGQEPSVPLGYIDQVNHTYAYFEQTYGTLNEKQVGMGESTCSAVYSAYGFNDGGAALWSIDELSRVAMERASSAREAVQLMGDLAVAGGFHGQSGALEGGGESLMVIDPMEGFVFHILADKTGTSAIWVAQRVPDDSMAVVANMYVIREVNLDDTVNFLGRQDMWDLAADDNLWTDGDPKDFTATFSDGEYGHQYYSGRRMWGAFRLVAPSYSESDLSPTYNNLKEDAPYPFAVVVENKLGVRDMLAVMRDWYEGTSYDLSAGLPGGFGGSPDRYGGCGDNTDCSNTTGNWERPIGLYRTSDSSVVQARSWLPDAVGGTLWFGPHAAHGTVYVPLAAGLLQAPPEYTDGWQGSTPVGQQRTENGGFWASRAVLNVAQLRFETAIPLVREQQQLLEERGLAVQAAADQAWLGMSSATTKSTTPSALRGLAAGASDHSITANATQALTAAYLAHTTATVRAWWQLSDELLFALADGFFNTWSTPSVKGAKENKKLAPKDEEEEVPVFTSTTIGYPAWWLEQVGYQNGPPPV